MVTWWEDPDVHFCPTKEIDFRSSFFFLGRSLLSISINPRPSGAQQEVSKGGGGTASSKERERESWSCLYGTVAKKDISDGLEGVGDIFALGCP